jgi:putative addiction module component (TIGR02574 family)
MLAFQCKGFVMSMPVEDLAAEALSLPPEDRAKLVERLIASFEPKSPAQAAWLKVASSRREDVRAGKAAMVPGDDALARVRARLA